MVKPIENRKHHFVPQLVLRNFSFNGKSLFAFDKWEEKSFSVSVKDAAAEKGFYSYSGIDGMECLEEFFQRIEDQAAPLIAAIVEQQKLPKFSSNEKTTLCRFAVAQIIRSKNHLALWHQSGDMLHTLAQHGTADFKAWVGERDLELERAHLLSNMAKTIDYFVPIFTSKDIILFIRGNNSRSLIIGDSPLVLTNTKDNKEEGGNRGFASVGIEIYLPLSPDLLIGFFCPSIDLDFRTAIVRHGRSAPRGAFDYVLALELNRAIVLENANVEHYNSLQVAVSERYVYSRDDDFMLVREMLGNNPAFRQGERMASNLDELIGAEKTNSHDA